MAKKDAKKMTIEEKVELLEAANKVCSNCVEDVFHDPGVCEDCSICESCPVRKMCLSLFDKKQKTVEEQKQAARNTGELLDHLVELLEVNEERFSFEWAVGGETATVEVFDKEKEIGYLLKVEPIEYDENGDIVNL